MATNEEVVSFINLASKLVLNEAMRRVAAGKPFVLPSIAIAQAAHESSWGTSSRMIKSYALYGIKAGGSWTGAVFTADTWEVANGVAYNTSANFRAYNSYEESVADYFDFIGNPRYASALSTKDNMLSAVDTINRIHAGGYATDPLYPGLILNMIKGRDLTQYDAVLAATINSGSFDGADIPEIDAPYTPPAEIPAADVIKYIFEKI